MQLKDYLQAFNLTQEEFGLRVGSDGRTVRKWLSGTLPSRKKMKLITEETKSLVGPGDFYETNEPEFRGN